MARRGGPHGPGLLRRPGLLGPRRSGVRRPERSARSGRPGPGRAGRQPHRQNVHRGPLRRLALRRPLPGGLRLATHQHGAGRRPRAHRRLRHRDGALRTAGQQADPGRARRVRAVPHPGARPPAAGGGRGGTGAVRLAGGQCALRAPAAPVLRPPGREHASRRADVARLLPPEPAEHVHGEADGADVRRRVHPGPAAHRRRPVRTRGRRAGERTGCAPGSGVTP